MTQHDLAELIISTIQEYLDNQEKYKNPVMIIGHDRGELVVHLTEAKRMKSLPDMVQYHLPDLYITDELSDYRPNFESILRIASDWVKDHVR